MISINQERGFAMTSTLEITNNSILNHLCKKRLDSSKTFPHSKEASNLFKDNIQGVGLTSKQLDEMVLLRSSNKFELVETIE